MSHHRLSSLTLSLVLFGFAATGSPGQEVFSVLIHPDDGTPHWYVPVAVPSGITWDQAHAAAKAAGGYLASITSAKENDFVSQLVGQDSRLWHLNPSTQRYIGPWIGAVQPPGSPEPGGNWQWTTVEPFAFSSWAVGQPDNQGSGEDRIHYAGSLISTAREWEDAPAALNLVRGYVIEYSGGSVPATAGLLGRDARLQEGYTLFGPTQTRNAYLIDSSGRLVNSWQSAYSGLSMYLLPSGDLMRNGVIQNGSFPGGSGFGGAGMLERYDWSGALQWQFRYADSSSFHHHDFEPMPNGNVLLIAWERKTRTQALDAGRNPSLLRQAALWPLKVVEIEPSGASGGRVVWEWHAWDHLIQDFDPTKANYGQVDAHPELVDLNYDTNYGMSDWLHTNAVNYNAKLDQILLSVRQFSEIWIIDHGTTTAEAAGHTGGRRGKGGDLLYRWGNPQTYRAGTSADQRLFGQHDAEWIPDHLPGGGNILVFNNGNGRPGTMQHSSVEELVPPLVNGGYVRTGAAFGPQGPTWIYRAPVPSDFYSPYVSGSQRRENGNTLVCDGNHGRLFEVTRQGDTVWEYLSPITLGNAMRQGEQSYRNEVFRCQGYAPDFPGFAGKNLTPRGPIELYAEALLANGARNPGFASIGATIDLSVIAAKEGGAGYQIATSETPGAIPIDFREIGLGFDAVLLVSLANLAPAVFQGYSGTLSPLGEARATMRIPASPSLVGRTVSTAFVTLDASVRSGIRTVSNACAFEIVP